MNELEVLAVEVGVLERARFDVERFAGPIYGLLMFAALQIGGMFA